MEELIYLPPNIADSDVLSIEAKKVLNALLNRQLNSDAKETGIITVGWNKLRKEAGVGMDLVKKLAFLLKDYNLISIEKCEWVQGRKDESTKFRINFEQLTKPLEKIKWGDMFSTFLKPTKSLETPISNKNKNKNTNKQKQSKSTLEQSKPEQSKSISTLEQSPLKEKDNLSSSFVKESKTLEELEVKNTLEEQLKEWAKAVNKNRVVEEDDDFELPS